MMESKSLIAVAPNGNGGVYAALRGSGVLANMAERKIEYLHAYCINNCLAHVADPKNTDCGAKVVRKNTDCGAKVVRKNTPDEPISVVCLCNSAFNVV
ncbi:UDP-N-acetylhexosamine pyrophosphorylase-like protein 1, partial [Podila verticillata]